MGLKWYFYSISGLCLIGTGLCFFGEALIKKISHENYFWWGTLSLVIFNTGICLVSHAIHIRKTKKH